MDTQTPIDPEVWALACCEEYRQSGTITFGNGKSITGKEALDLYKFLDTKYLKGRRKIVQKPEDYLPRETK